MTLYDAHCHLQDSRLLKHAARVVQQAESAGVAQVACCGTHEGDWETVLTLARTIDGITPCIGLHPWFVAGRSPDWLATLRCLLETHPEAAVGEVGLDHALKERNDDEQACAFGAQLALAGELDRPVSIHCRRAWAALRRALDEAGPLTAGFMVHSFSGSPETLKWILEAGGYVSFSGAITRPSNRARLLVAQVPTDRLLVETDAPDMMPVRPHCCSGGPSASVGIRRDAATRPVEYIAGGPNEPRFLTYVLGEVAALRGEELEDVAETSAKNARRLFSFTDDESG